MPFAVTYQVIVNCFVVIAFVIVKPHLGNSHVVFPYYFTNIPITPRVGQVITIHVTYVGTRMYLY